LEAAAYQALRDLQDEHWWFVGRRRIIRELIAAHVPLPSDAAILEAGCGYGGNLPLLQEFGRVSAFEYDDQARAFAARASGIAVAPGALPDRLDLGGRTFDLIAMLDVLEHIEEDSASLARLGEHLAPGGRMVITVPAFAWLWSRHDEVHHHKRRYSRAALKSALARAGLRPVRTGYFNTLLFPLALVQRLASRLRSQEAAAERLPPAPLNRALAAIFGSERWAAARWPLPFGLSLYAVAERADRP
jgi:SAM-dependent methyltransferase